MAEDDLEKPRELPIDGILDLHAFNPREVKELVSDYIGVCLERGIRELRLIHGKGSGTLRAVVRSTLEKDPRVAGYRDAEPLSGGWGATLVVLKAGAKGGDRRR